MKSNIKAFWPAFVVAILIALFSTVLPAQGGFPTTSPSALPAASFFVVQQVSGNSTGVRVDSLLAASADGNGIYSSSAAVPNGRIASNAAGDLVFNVPFQGANPYTGFFRTDVSGSSYAGLSETLSGQTSHFGFYDSSNSAAFFKSNVDGSHMHYFNGVANQSDLIFSATGAVFTQTGGLGGIKYNADYSAAYSDRSLIDRGFLNSRAPAQPYGRIAYGTGTGLTGEANLFYSPVLDYLRLGSNISAVGADSSAIGLFLSGNGKRIYFGDNGTGVPSSYGNAWLGEKGKTDSDALELHGASGIYFTGSGYNSDTDSTSVFMHIASEHSFNTSAVANKIRFPKYGSARNDYSVADPASIYYPDQWGWLRRTLSDSIKVTNPITNSGLVTLRTALRSLNDMIAEPANQILYGTGSGIGSSSSFTYDAVNGDLGITLNDNEQSFYITPVNNGVVTGYDNNNTGAFWYIENIEDDMLLSIHSSGEPEIKLDVNQDTSSIVLLSGSGSNSVEIFTSNLDETRISAIKNFPNGNKASILFPNPDSIVSDFYYNLPSKSGTIAMLDDIATDIDNNRIVRGTGSGIEGDTSLSFINTAHEIGGTIINRGIHVFDSSISGKAVFGTDENGLAVVLDAITESVIKVGSDIEIKSIAGRILTETEGDIEMNSISSVSTITPNFIIKPSGAIKSKIAIEDNAGGQNVAITVPATVTTSYTLTLPPAAPLSNGKTFLFNTDGTGSFGEMGSLSVGAGGANTSLINSSTSGSTAVTISGGTNVTVTESGSTITIAAASATEPDTVYINVHVLSNQDSIPAASTVMDYNGYVIPPSYDGWSIKQVTASVRTVGDTGNSVSIKGRKSSADRTTNVSMATCVLAEVASASDVTNTTVLEGEWLEGIVLANNNTGIKPYGCILTFMLVKP